jgi:hypothetical protein
MGFREKYFPETFDKEKDAMKNSKLCFGGAVCFDLRDDPRGQRGHGLEFHRLNNHRDEWR